MSASGLNAVFVRVPRHAAEGPILLQKDFHILARNIDSKKSFCRA
jgi:hypothetical protein